MLDGVSNESAVITQLSRFLKPLPRKVTTTADKPIITGVAAIKKNMLSEQGNKSLAQIRAENETAMKYATPLKFK